jgi:predicted AAA+ superfamily ATPase
MATSNRERVGRGLELLRDGLGPYVFQQSRAKLPSNQADAITRRLLPKGMPKEAPKPADLAAQMDVQEVIFVMWDFWREVFHDQLGHAGRTLLSELRNLRNDWAHMKKMDVDDAYRALDSITRMLEAVSAPQAVETRSIATTLLHQKLEVLQKTNEKIALQSTPVSSKGLKPWRDVVQPHPDVASNHYSQAEFAADLWLVSQNRAGAEYGDPKEFFRRTFPTEGIRRLARLALERLSGKGGEPVIELQTSFGGGKTHSLLVLYHLFGGQVRRNDAEAVETFLSEAGLQEPPQARRAVVVGTKLDPAQPWTKKDGTEIRTLWGEIAWQLGGREGFEMIAESDRKSVSPGGGLIRLFERYAPCLVLIDEWVVFARQLVDRTDLSAGTFEANMSFAQSLTEAAVAVPGAMVVIALPESDIEKGGPAGDRALEQLRHVVRRVEGVWKPATAEESFEIVRRRLFSEIEDVTPRNITCQAFADMYQRQRGEFPSECAEPSYAERMRRAYPIHPELFDRLYIDWSTIDKFQRTRGVLRLMAKMIHHLWTRGDQAPMILPGTIPLDAPDLKPDFIHYLPDGWDAVLDSDVDGVNSRPFHLDAKEINNFGRIQAARRVARTVFLGSAPSVTGQQVRGIEQVRVKLGAAMPGDPSPVFGDALRRLSEELTFLYADGSRYWYDTRANINRTARDRASQVKPAQIEDRIVDLLRKKRGRGPFAAVHVAPASPGDVPDEQQLRLVLLGTGAPWHSKQETSPAVEAASQILTSRGTGPRTWQNTLIFLAPERDPLLLLEDAVRHWLAWESIENDIESGQLDVGTYQKKQAEGKLKQAEITVTVRLTETWSRLLIPQQDGRKPIAWSVERLPSGDGTFEERAGKKLVPEGTLFETLGPDVLALYMERNNLWQKQDHVSVRQIWDWTCQYLYMPKLRDQNVLLTCIQDAARSIHSPFAYANSWNEETGYHNLAFTGAQTTVRADGSSVLVRIEKAQEQRRAEEEKERALRDRGNGGIVEPIDPIGPVDPSPPPPPPERSIRRFHASVPLPPLGIGGKAGQIGDEILQHLAKLPKAQMGLSLEIQVRLPEGAPESVRRIVEENCRTLKFTSFGFEEE